MKTFIKECRHGNFILMRGDMISTYVDMYGEWSEVEVELFQDILAPTSNVIEVGANIGMHTIPLSAFCHQGVVFAYEPQRPIFHLLCGNIAINNRLNIIAKNAAVGGAPGAVQIHTSTYDEPWNYGAFSVEKSFSKEGQYNGPTAVTTVPMVKLDEDPELLAAPSIDLIKIDAEGFEPNILLGAWGLIATHKPHLFLEANDEAVVSDCLTILNAAGYIGYWVVGSRFRANNFNKNWVRVDNVDINIFFTHPSRPVATRRQLQRVSNFGDIARGVPILS
jgi:FkbM family methyltransferase